MLLIFKLFLVVFQLPKFFYLCKDSVWGVRKACADAFMPVSCVCSRSVRHSELSPLFINLLRDQSRWVRMAAFQALGHFISTFADPSITGLLNYDNGEIVITDPEQLSIRLTELEEQRAKEALDEKQEGEEEEALKLDQGQLMASEKQHESGPQVAPSSTESIEDGSDVAKKSIDEATDSDSLVPPPICDAETVISDSDIVIESSQTAAGHLTETNETSTETNVEDTDGIMELCDPAANDSNGNSIMHDAEVRLISQSFENINLCPEEIRAKSYLDSMLPDVNAENFNSFLFWREPLINLDPEKESSNLIKKTDSSDDGIDDEQVVNCLTGGGLSSLKEDKFHPPEEDDEEDDDDMVNIEPLTGEGDHTLETISKTVDIYDGTALDSITHEVIPSLGGSRGNRSMFFSSLSRTPLKL